MLARVSNLLTTLQSKAKKVVSKLGQGGVVLRRLTRHVLGSMVACQRARRRLANKTVEEETNLYGDENSSIFLSNYTGPFFSQ